MSGHDLLLLDDGPAPVAKRRGLVRADGRAWRDDGGLWHPLGHTFFWAPFGWRSGDRDRVARTWDWFAGYGVQHQRILGEVGGKAWTGQEIDPRWPDYLDAMAGVVDGAWDRGMRTILTLRGGGTSSDPIQHAYQIAELVRGREERFLYLEAANEQQGVSDDEIRRMLDILRPTGVLLAASSPPDADESADYAHALGATVATPHFDRAKGDLTWRPIRQPWPANGWRGPADNAEGIGPRSSVEECTDPLQLALYRATSVLVGVGAFTFHNGACVYGRPDPAHNRPPNPWEVGTDANPPACDVPAIMRAVRDIDLLLPEDIENWQKFNWHWGGQPLRPDFCGDSVVYGEADHGCVRVFSAARGSEFVTVVLGVKDHVMLTAPEDEDVTIYEVPTWEKRTARVGAGQALRLEGAPDASAGYIVRGTR